MPKVSFKRQITLPIEQCREAHIDPGDEVDIFVHNGHITVVKKLQGAAQGFLADVEVKKKITDRASLQSTIDDCN